MNAARQFLGILGLNLAGITRRIAMVLTIIIGVTCAVAVLVSMLAMGSGARQQEMGFIAPDRVVLTSLGARGLQSNIPREEAAAIRDLPGLRKDANGQPIVVLQTFVPSEGRRRVTGNRIFFPLMGTSTAISAYLPEMHFTRGRMFQRGLHELIASNSCPRQFTDFEIGAQRPLRGIDWTVVGLFDQGSMQQCVVYADVDAVMSTFSRNSYSQVSVQLQSAADYDRFRAAVAANPTLHLEVQHESEAVEEQFKPLNTLLDFVSYFVGTIMAIAATLGAVNSLYAIVDSRRRELATLRAIGFGSGPIAVSILCESVLLAVPGAVLGSALAWTFFNGMAASPFGFTFQLAVTPHLAVLGTAWALGMGLIGGLLPALRAGRVPVTTALRAT
jgi:putative ABC transport system permease protein